ncbi:MAG: flagellar hook-basal body complex protein [Rhodospirillales bacterium]|nr:flagellar hook-basal body complex protein [Rhodospirillales bacterium]
MATIAMDAAISGLVSMQTAINYISDNVSNAQTTGFKRVDSNFSSYVSTAASRFFSPGGVTARPNFINDLQGSIVQDASPTAIAITGAGWLPVQDGSTSAGGFTGNNITQFTRRGDFALDTNSFLVNGAGKFLFARSVPRPTVAVPNPSPSAGPLTPVQIDQSQLPALPTSRAIYAANLPANAPPGTVYNGGTITVTDANGAARAFSLTWYNRTTAGGTLPGVPASASTGTAAIPASAAGTTPQWRLVITAPTSSGTGIESITADYTFGAVIGVDAGLLTGITNPQTTDSAASPSFQATVNAADGRLRVQYAAPAVSAPPPASNYQNINVEFGTPNKAIPTVASALSQPGGMSQFGGTTISISTVTADGYAAGIYNGVGMDRNGNIFTTYSNGQRLVQYQIALATFNNSKGLVRQNGEAFLDDPAAGFIGFNATQTGGAGGVNPNSLENSNVDIGTEFTKMIVAQRSYSANAKIITTADEMLQEIVNIKR